MSRPISHEALREISEILRHTRRSPHEIMDAAEVYQGMSDRIDLLLPELKRELLKATTHHRPMHSAHEGHSVIREELEELWDHVKEDTGTSGAARKEALQVAAMGLRYIIDLCDGQTQHSTMYQGTPQGEQGPTATDPKRSR
jgi:hypothetical protein